MGRLTIFSAVLFSTWAVFAQTTAIPASVSCPAFKPATQEYLFSQSNPSAATVDGIGYPGNQRTLFRGAQESNTQFDLSSSLQAMFGESGWRLNSPLVWAISQILMGEWDLDHAFFPNSGLPNSMESYLEDRGLLKDVQTLQKCRGEKFYKKNEAEALASNLVNKMFHQTPRKDLNFRYLDIENPDYYEHSYTSKGFGNKAVEFVTGSNYDQVASIYGKKVLVFKDTRDRGVDLTYWNYKKNKRFWDSWVDSGEINIPAAITGGEILGYQNRASDRQHFGGAFDSNMPNNAIEQGYYRYEFNNENFVLVFDGGQSLCMAQGSDRKMYKCSTKKWDQLMKTHAVPRPTPEAEDEKNRLGLIAVISTCTKDTCASVDKIMNWYGHFSETELDSGTVEMINELKVNGHPLKVHATAGFAERQQEAAEKAKAKKQTQTPPQKKKGQATAQPAWTGIKIVSAIYGKDDVTQKSAQFANGKEAVDYKIRSWRLGLAKSTDSRAFTITWVCSKDPKNPIQKTIAAPAEAEEFSIDCSESGQ